MSEVSDGNQEREMTAEDENRYIAQRREKLTQLRQQGQAYPNHFKREDFAQRLHAEYGELSREQLDHKSINVTLAGRMMFKRVMGKASFAQLQDMSGIMQIFVQRDAVGEANYEQDYLPGLPDGRLEQFPHYWTSAMRQAMLQRIEEMIGIS